MLGFVALGLQVLGWIIWWFSESLAWPIIIGIAGIIVAGVDLFMLYKQEKLDIQDFVKEAFRTNWYSAIAVVSGIGLIISTVSLVGYY